MTAPNLALLVNGDPLTVGVEYSITVTHGRNDITSSPQPSDAQINLYGFATIPCAIGDTLVIEAYGGPRFTGFITDLTLQHLADGTGVLTVQAVGTLARLGFDYVGAAGYPQEDLADRVDNILSETAYVYTNNSDPLYSQLALDAQDGGYSALDLLLALGTETGGTLADLPDGAILWESYSRRGYGYNPAIWSDVVEQWQNVPYIWADVFETTEAVPLAVDLNESSVVWSPIWRNTSQTIINRVTVIYGNSGNQEHTETDASSIAAYGLRSQTITTQFHHSQDAIDRAEALIRAQSQPRYNMQNVSILVHMLSGTQLTEALGLLQGSRVEIQNLPAPHPYQDYLGVVEGWSETYTENSHVLTLSLSDPRYSYAVAKWSQVDPTLLWSGVRSGVQWYNVVLPGDLLPV